MDIRSACRHAVRKNIPSMKCWESLRGGGVEFRLFYPVNIGGVLYRLYFYLLLVGVLLCLSFLVWVGGGGLVALFNSRPSRFT